MWMLEQELGNTMVYYIHVQEQFIFIHDAILESVTCGDTQIAATNLRMNIAKMKKKDAQNQSHGFHYQFKVHVPNSMVKCSCFNSVPPYIPRFWSR